MRDLCCNIPLDTANTQQQTWNATEECAQKHHMHSRFNTSYILICESQGLKKIAESHKGKEVPIMHNNARNLSMQKQAIF